MNKCFGSKLFKNLTLTKFIHQNQTNRLPKLFCSRRRNRPPGVPRCLGFGGCSCACCRGCFCSCGGRPGASARPDHLPRTPGTPAAATSASPPRHGRSARARDTWSRDRPWPPSPGRECDLFEWEIDVRAWKSARFVCCDRVTYMRLVDFKWRINWEW